MIKAEITDSELLAHMDSIHKDEMTIFVMADGEFRGAFFNGTKLVNQMRAQHNLGILETMVLGQAMLCAALLIPMMKGREHITFRYDTNGPAAGFSVEADSTGYVRGFLFQNQIPVEKPLENWDLAPFFGDGTLTISRLGEGMKEPQIGTVEIMHKNIAKDLAWYFLQSEQIHTAFNTSIQFDEKGRVIGAGGMFLQKMPSEGGKRVKSNQNELSQLSEDELTQKVENAFKAMPSIGKWFSDGGDMEDVIYGLFREFEPKAVLNRDVIFDCPCSEENFIAHIKHLPAQELNDIIKNDPAPIEVVCHCCGSRYKIKKEQLK
ncbi:Hsp33 family molecular chaperone HslO [uncultured Treponema sp.]|uniref:Hsp33 family molecular chaperone HslO n=1 Tax=uncultured Treponema sp. TaxID=162155 RepID=UPI0025E97B13|nr:Hsp33 family molecular chaperone HslO [uncultured Treponema sp.]